MGCAVIREAAFRGGLEGRGAVVCGLDLGVGVLVVVARVGWVVRMMARGVNGCHAF